MAVWPVLWLVGLERTWEMEGWQGTSILSLHCPATWMYDIWSGVLKRCSSPMKSQEDSQEVGCGVDWLSTIRATEEPFR